MLFSIYAASLIALSSGMALEKRQTKPDAQQKCKLYVYVSKAHKVNNDDKIDAFGTGWVTVTSDGTLSVTSGVNQYNKGTEFEWGLPLTHKTDKDFKTLKIMGPNAIEKQVSWKVSEKWTLSMRNRPEDGFEAVGFVTVNHKDPNKEQRSELVGLNMDTKVQYCTSKDTKSVELRGYAANNNNFDCVDARLFPRFTHTAPADSFPQTVKIAIYSLALEFIGWIVEQPDNKIYYANNDGLFPYRTASLFTLNKHESGNILITSDTRNMTIAKAGSTFGFTEGTTEQFTWKDGNPHQLIPAQGSIFHCDNPDDIPRPTFRKEELKPLPEGFQCKEVIWIVAAVEYRLERRTRIGGLKHI